MVFVFVSVGLFGFMGSSFAVTGNNSSLNSSNITNNSNSTNIIGYNESITDSGLLYKRGGYSGEYY